MSNFNFTSQICTTKEQSQRLLDLGLKPETADMYYFWLGENNYRLKVDIDNDPLKYNMDKTYIPAWSLHRLIEIYSTPNINCYVIFTETAFDELIDDIEQCINNKGYFNKEYLKQ